MGLSEYARHRGCRLNAVQVAILSGRIKRDAAGRIDSEQADRDWVENTLYPHSTHGKPKSKTVEAVPAGAVAVAEPLPRVAYMKHRSERELWSAKLRKIEVEEKQKTLVSRKEVEAEAFRSHRVLRDACFNIPSRMSAQLAAESDARIVHQILEAELRQIFNAFAEGKL